MNLEDSVAQLATKQDPDAALAAICVPSALTLSHIAALERVKSPLLLGKTSDTLDNIIGCYIASAPSAAAVLNQYRDGTLEAAALAWVEKFPSPNDYIKCLAATLDAIAAFWSMLPRAAKETASDGTSKKETASETASSPN